MNKILNSNGYGLTKNNLKEKQLLQIKKKLHVKPKVNDDYNKEVVEFDVFRETEEVIYVPRFFGTKNFGEPDSSSLDSYEKINIKFKGTLRDEQIKIAEICINKAKEEGGGILQLPCGSGKTIIMIYIACMLGIKTLVITHKSFLQEQWMTRINEFTDAKIGLIRQDKIVTKNKDIVVGMLQSLSMIDYDKKIFEGFGLVIYDEVHHMGARVFSNSLFKTGFKYLFGLSATPDRSDGMMKIINWFIGDILFKMERKEDPNVDIYTFLYMTKETNFIEKKAYIKGSLKPNLPSSLTCLTKVVTRNNLLINIIDVLRKKKDTTILALSARLEHLEFIKNSTDDKIKNDKLEMKKQNQELDYDYEDYCRTYYYIGASTQNERKMAEENGDIIFATYDMASEALDIPRVNVVILMTPPISKKMFVQSIGRCMRNQNNIKNPLIVDIQDQLSMYDRLSKVRNEHYKISKYNLKEIYVNSDKIITKKEYLKDTYKMTDDEILSEFGKTISDECEINIHKLFD